jgi:hypothetical protein
MSGPVYGNGLGAIAQEQPAMAALATQNQALMLEVEVLKKQQAAMQQLFQQMVKQNEHLAAANTGGSAALKETVQQLDNGQMARDAEIELLRQEITLFKAQQEEANANHADEIRRKDGLIAQLERRVTYLEARQGPYQELTQSIKEIASTDFIRNLATPPGGVESRIKFDILPPTVAARYLAAGKEHAKIADGLLSAVAKVDAELLKVEKEELKALNDNQESLAKEEQ